jgi:PAS domain S-box-containing protein
MRRVTSRERARGYGIAVSATAAAVAVRLLLSEMTSLVFVTLYPAVMASAWWGGRGPAMLSVGLCALTADYLWIPPAYSVVPAHPQDWMNLLLFLGVGGAIGIVTSKLRESQARLRSVLEATADGFAIVDRNWRYRYVNPAFAALVRRPERDLLGHDVRELFPDAETSSFGETGRAAMSGVAGHLTEYYPPLGVWFDVTIYPAREGIALVARDATAAKDMELRRAELLKQLELTNRLKDEFLATLSHEMRTPLNALMGWAAMLDAGAASPPRAVGSILKNAEALKMLVEDLLDTSSILQGKLHIERKPTDLTRIIKDAVETVRAAVTAHGVRLTVVGVNESLWVMGDAGRLRQAVLNLLANAVKFTPEGGSIGLSLAGTDATTTLVVQDTGVGIAANVLPRIFERFVQGDSTPARATQGLGLGLALAKHVVEAHGGTIDAFSKGPLMGATFTVTLPLIEIATASAQTTGGTRGLTMLKS